MTPTTILNQALSATGTSAIPMHGVTWVEQDAALRAIELARGEAMRECQTAIIDASVRLYGTDATGIRDAAAYIQGQEGAFAAIRNLPADPLPTDGWQPIEALRGSEVSAQAERGDCLNSETREIVENIRWAAERDTSSGDFMRALLRKAADMLETSITTAEQPTGDA